MSATITVRVSSSNFAKGVKYAKQFGGKFNPTTKTWTIPTHRNGIYNNALNAPGLYGLIVVSGTANTHKHDASCPANFGGVCECDVCTG